MVVEETKITGGCIQKTMVNPEKGNPIVIRGISQQKYGFSSACAHESTVTDLAPLWFEGLWTHLEMGFLRKAKAG
jgi:hypothetical protein